MPGVQTSYYGSVCGGCNIFISILVEVGNWVNGNRSPEIWETGTAFYGAVFMCIKTFF